MCFSLVFCAGCGQSIFSVGKNAIAVPQAVAQPHTSSATSVSLPLPVEKKPVHYEMDAGYTSSYHTAVLTEDVILRGKVLISGVLTIAPQATLRVIPGTVVSFAPDRNSRQDGALVIRGRIEAVGTADSLIDFKAATSEKSRDGWRGIILLGSEKNNLLEDCRIEGATVGVDSIYSTISLKNTQIFSCRTGARLQGSLFQSLGGGVSDSGQGYELRDSESYLRDVSCKDNLAGVFLSRGSLGVNGATFSGNTARALEAIDSSIKISGAVFSRNGTGLAFKESEGSVESCKIVENREYGLQLLHSRIKIFANQIFMNTGIGIMSDSGGSAAWGNNISLNGLYDFYYSGSEEFRAIGNWWGRPAEKSRKNRVFDQKGLVLTLPELSALPSGLP